ncbi:integrase core domain-containing protein [Streptomyces sp. NPDC057565]|uniref:integrase core domain-containing protein n=1 Tax=Streptomyces sp. NPDC057565 TaxID=3346169 RepID=UPI0036C52FF5
MLQGRDLSQIARVRYECADRIWLAVFSRLVPRERWRQVFAVTPTTLLAWHRRLVSRTWTFTERRHPGRPPTAPAVRQLILGLARENSTWGHRRIQGELVRLGYSIAPSTVWEIPQSSGVDPAPHRSGPTWRQFLTTQAHGIIAADFLHLDTVTLGRLYALIFIEHGTRGLHLADVTAHPTAQWTVQQARNPAMMLGCRMASLRFPLRDRDAKRTDAFDAVFQADDVQILLSPPQAPRANTICERAVGTLRRELLDRTLIYNKAHAQAVPAEYIRHHNQRRPHRSRQQLPPGQLQTTRSSHRHRPPGPANPATAPPRRPDQPGPEDRLTERPRRSSQHRIVFSRDTGASGDATCLPPSPSVGTTPSGLWCTAFGLLW